MNDLNSQLYTSFISLSFATMVLSKLYRKKQTNIECTNKFWNQCWKYIVTKQKYNESINNILHPDDEELFEINMANVTRIRLYNNIHFTLNIYKPSYTVTKFISKIIDKKLEQLSIKNKFEIIKHFQKRPLTILVPLCGCSYDLYYISLLLQNKYKFPTKCFKIIGIEYSLIAIRNFFKLNGMAWVQSSYNPKYMIQSNFYRIQIYSQLTHSIHIFYDDIFKLFDLSQECIAISNTPSLIKPKSIDIIIDINAMSCINPSDRKMYAYAMKYWLADNGFMLLNTYCYDPKISNYPPFTTHSTDISQLYGIDKCILLDEKIYCINGIQLENKIHQSWLIHK
eukprot:44407_1